MGALWFQEDSTGLGLPKMIQRILVFSLSWKQNQSNENKQRPSMESLPSSKGVGLSFMFLQRLQERQRKGGASCALVEGCGHQRAGGSQLKAGRPE